MFNHLCKDPFRFFFPLAIACLLYGCSLWFTYAFFGIGEAPITQHATLFVGGFLYFSILGFLLTAIPRFTGSNFLSLWELVIFIVHLMGVVFSYFLDSHIFYWAFIASGWVTFLFFAVPRFVVRKQNPPFTFVFVGLGVVLGLLGSSLNFLAALESGIFGALKPWGKLFFYDGMVTCFILGVGGRLIPGILGFVESVAEQRRRYEQPKRFLSIIPRDIIFAFIAFILSLVLEGFGLVSTAFVIRGIVITYFSFKYWRLHEKVKSQKWHGKVLKLSCFMLLFGSWVICFGTEYTIHFKHLIYIGSYCLMTLMVASRVIVAHSNESLDIEFKKWPALALGIILLIAAFTRASALFIEGSYIRHLGYTALMLGIAVLIWISVYFKKVLFHFSEENN
tara:strand:+ start:10518 stop:11696 length:1179 start_codon:yes stop_codon:yes gene_type:complete